MQVAELITLMGHLSVGNDNITAAERGIFLHYLNLGHLELYQETANFNQELIITEHHVTQPAENGEQAATLSRMPYLVDGVFDQTHQRPLCRFSVGELTNGTFAASTGRTSFGYAVQKNILSFMPALSGAFSVTVWYIPQPSRLREDMGETDIPYPIAFHPVLVDGALYYLFQEEGGFKSSQRETEAKARWQTGKTRLLSYLFSSGGQGLSTFSNA